MTRVFVLQVRDDGTICLPDDILKELGWQQGQELSLQVGDDSKDTDSLKASITCCLLGGWPQAHSVTKGQAPTARGSRAGYTALSSKTEGRYCGPLSVRAPTGSASASDASGTLSHQASI